MDTGQAFRAANHLADARGDVRPKIPPDLSIDGKDKGDERTPGKQIYAASSSEADW